MVFEKVWMGSEGSKSPQNGSKMRVLAFWKKYDIFRHAFLFHYESANGLLTFCKDKMFGKNPILELWSKNLKTYQNARFIKLQYLTNKLRYEVEFLDVNRSL